MLRRRFITSQQISAGMEEIAAGTQNQAQDVQAGTDQIEARTELCRTLTRRQKGAHWLRRYAATLKDRPMLLHHEGYG